MLAHLVERLQTLQRQNPLFNEIKRGIERETLRTTPEGTLAPTGHSPLLGSKLTHPHITTDYSENLLELITAPHTEVDSLLQELLNIHAFTAQAIPDERLWPMSMPCTLGGTNDIPIANYGTSNSGKMKMHYRRGLSHRYGRHMQCIAGLHYNFSLPQSFWEVWHESFDPCHRSLQDCIDANYMRMTRNYLKHAWLIFMLMGNSPACDASFFTRRAPDFLKTTSAHTYYSPYACSLRMSRIGYQSKIQDNIRISYNSLDHYIRDLLKATLTPSEVYQSITEQHGPEAQLNPNLLQIEAELYSPIRPKQMVRVCERPTKALASRGIQYLEVRGIDVNPESPIGITADQVYFLDTFLMFCLLHNCPTFSADKAMQWHNNQSTAVLEGLKQGTVLQKGDKLVSIRDWGTELFEQLFAVAGLMDTHHPDKPHENACKAFQAKFLDTSTLPSAQQIQAISHGEPFIAYGQQLAEQHHKALLSHPLPAALRASYEAIAQKSLSNQKDMESGDTLDYGGYLTCYFS